MKKCKNCQNIQNDETLVCADCGGQEFDPVEADQPQYNFTPGEIKGKLSPWQILLIVIGCVAILGAGIFAVTNIVGGERYTKGEIIDGVYINEWANMKFRTNEMWKDITAEEASYYEDEYVDCGLVADDIDNGRSMVITFQHIGNNIGYSEQDGLNDYLEGVEEEMSKVLNTEVVFSDFFTVTVAGEEFTAIKTDHGGLYYYYACLRYEGEYAVMIDIFANNEQEIIDVLASFEPAVTE